MRILFKYIIRPIIYPIAEIFLYASISALIVFLCIALLGDTYGILAVFLERRPLGCHCLDDQQVTPYLKDQAAALSWAVVRILFQTPKPKPQTQTNTNPMAGLSL